MNILRCLVLSGVVSPVLLAAESTTFQPPAMEVADGFEIDVIAAPPLVKYPMLGCFDERGRFFVCESAGKNMDGKTVLEKLPNFIRLIEDTDADGRFDKSTIFADKLAFPSGALWHEGALYVTSPPSLWRLEDTDGDGVADRRDEILTKFKTYGHAGDIHGPWLGPDGRLYLLNAPLGHEIRDKNGKIISKGTASRVFTFRADGSDLETYCGGGMWNPVEIAFTPQGDMLGITTWYNPDAERRDAFLHFVYGGVYPKNEPAWLAEFKRTGPLMPAMKRYGVVAPSSLWRYRGVQFGEAYRDSYFVSYFNTRKVTRVQIERHGATFRFGAEEEDFLTSPSPDFRPCEVIEDADGSLILIDTGGWFVIGCPTSRVEKPEVLGAIYRIRRSGAAPLDNPRGQEIGWQGASPTQLIELLDDPRPSVRDRSVAALARRGDVTVPALHEALRSSKRTRVRRNAIWALTRHASTNARAAVRSALSDRDVGVRLAAVRSVASIRDGSAVTRLGEMVVDDAPEIRREAAGALGRVFPPSVRSTAVPPLLEAARHMTDRFVEHAVIFALIEIDIPQLTAVGLKDPSPDVQRAALMALDQMDSGNLTPEMVRPFLSATDPKLWNASMDIVRRRESWSGEIVKLLEQWLSETSVDASRQDQLRRTLLAFRTDAKVQELVSAALARPETTRETRLAVLEFIGQSDLEVLPSSWREQVHTMTMSTNAAVARQAVVAIGSCGDRSDRAGLITLAADSQRPTELRVAAANVAAGAGTALDDGVFNLLLESSQANVDSYQRLTAARALASAPLNPTQRVGLLKAVSTAGPMELPLLLRPFEEVSDGESETQRVRLGTDLLAALKSAPGTANLSAARMRKLLDAYPQAVRDGGRAFLQELAPDMEAQSLRLRELASALTAGGDPANGRKLFFGTTASCRVCHRVESKDGQPGPGGNVGPDLSRIGEVRNARDLLEAIVFPSASLARGFESFTVGTKTGEVKTGVIRREAVGAIYLRIADASEVRIPREDILTLVPSATSVMPQGLDRTLTVGELRDMIAYLKTLKG